ncbi:Ehd1 [Symbiodinium natans]|uniref:Ehd1 protein n=1 Tax=Symbiodinium natans TaxID=878477 RepID=A0A812TL60_9DINO|nr:Ehd1 [Symbiodinium natans]
MAEDEESRGRRDRSKELGVLRKLWQIYAETVLPLEQKSFYEHFCAPPISLEEFEARPQVLLLGQYSTGKTSMVKWLTESESNYFDVRPQPSTDKFMAVVHGEEEGIIHGNAAACLPQLPYQGLSKFGTDFLGSFQALVLPSEILRDITFIDTPGVLSGSKQRIGRDYDFAKISAWMADRADLVLLTFDAHKLDISDEFQQVMEVLRPHAGKVRCVLNKADQIDASNLVRVYGALLWNVGKVFQTPEVARVFVSSFWNEEYRFKDHQTLFEEDKAAVVKELQSLPHTALLRKINNLTARVRRVRTHVIVVGYLRSRIPLHLRALGADGPIRHWLCSNLESLLSEAQRVHGLSSGDMPKLEVLRGKLHDFEQGLLRLPVPTTADVRRLDSVLEKEAPVVGILVIEPDFPVGLVRCPSFSQELEAGMFFISFIPGLRQPKTKKVTQYDAATCDKNEDTQQNKQHVDGALGVLGPNPQAAALKLAASRGSPTLAAAIQAGKFPKTSVYEFGTNDALHAAPAPAKPTRAALIAEKPPKPQPREVPQSVVAAAAAIGRAVASSLPAGAPALVSPASVAPAAPAAPSAPPAAPAVSTAPAAAVHASGTATDDGYGGSVWLTSPGVSAESRLAVRLPQGEFTYIDRPWSHFATRWAAIDAELHRSVGEAAFSLIDLGSCCGFFSLQAAVAYPKASVFGVEGSVGIGNGTAGLEGTQDQIVGTKAVQTHLRWIARLKLPNCFLAPDVWDFQKVSDLASSGVLCDVLLLLSVVHHVDNVLGFEGPRRQSLHGLLVDLRWPEVSTEQYAERGWSRVEALPVPCLCLACASPVDFVLPGLILKVPCRTILIQAVGAPCEGSVSQKGCQLSS